MPLVLPVSDKGNCVHACEPTAEEADCKNSDNRDSVKTGSLSVHRADTSIPSRAGTNNGSPGAAVAGRGKTWFSVSGEARSSRSTPSQHCPPLEPELGDSHGDFSVSPNLLQSLTGLHIVLVSVYSGLAAPWPAESWM